MGVERYRLPRRHCDVGVEEAVRSKVCLLVDAFPLSCSPSLAGLVFVCFLPCKRDLRVRGETLGLMREKNQRYGNTFPPIKPRQTPR